MENGTPDDYARFLQRAAERQSQSNAELATWLRSWLERRGMSQKAFSIRACLGAEEVSKLCSARLNWSPRYMSRISEATGLAISQIHRQAEAV